MKVGTKLKAKKATKPALKAAPESTGEYAEARAEFLGSLDPINLRKTPHMVMDKKLRPYISRAATAAGVTYFTVPNPDDDEQCLVFRLN